MTIDDIFDKAVRVQDDGTRSLPGPVVMAADTQGNLDYSKTYGVRTLNPDGAQALDLNATFRMASITKLMTSIAAMQTVERDILEGFDESDEPILRKAKNKITLGLLLCLSSGIAYDALDTRLMEWRKKQGQEAKMLCDSIDEGYTYPLVFDPGEGWAYGAGIDWARRLAERLHGNVRLGEYMGKHIWTPLGMTSTTFNLETNPDINSRTVDMTVRAPTGQLSHFPTSLYPSPAKDDCGGVGSYSSAPDYMKVLTSLLLTMGNN